MRDGSDSRWGAPGVGAPMALRGPDVSGTRLQRNVALGHRRVLSSRWNSRTFSITQSWSDSDSQGWVGR